MDRVAFYVDGFSSTALSRELNTGFRARHGVAFIVSNDGISRGQWK
jgi:hypothetical protein